jgi:hypothetical protein
MTFPEWVVVSFEDAIAPFDLDALDALLPYEMDGDDALQRAGIGRIDGNEVAERRYDIRFAGSDRHAMWALLAPVFADAPTAWTRVELRVTREDPRPIVLRRG